MLARGLVSFEKSARRAGRADNLVALFVECWGRGEDDQFT